MQVLVEHRLESSERGRLMAVLADAQVAPSDAPSAQAAPVDVARHPLEVPARDPADHALARPTKEAEVPGLSMSARASRIDPSPNTSRVPWPSLSARAMAERNPVLRT